VKALKGYSNQQQYCACSPTNNLVPRYHLPLYSTPTLTGKQVHWWLILKARLESLRSSWAITLHQSKLTHLDNLRRTSDKPLNICKHHQSFNPKESETSYQLYKAQWCNHKYHEIEWKRQYTIDETHYVMKISAFGLLTIQGGLHVNSCENIRSKYAIDEKQLRNETLFL